MITWQSAHNSHLSITELREDDGAVIVSIGRNGEGQTCQLVPYDARQVAAELVLRANVIDPPAKQSAGPCVVYASELRTDGSSSRMEAELISGELHLRIYPNGSHIYQVAVVPIEDVRSVLSTIRDVAFPDERCPF